MPDEIRIDSLWTLRPLEQAYDQWSLYTNQIPLFKTEARRYAFYNSGRPNVNFAEDSDLLAQVRILVEEVRAGLPAVAVIEGFTSTAVLSSLTHWPSGEWIDQTHEVEELQWTRTLKLGGQPLRKWHRSRSN